jgi:sugar lactone lactonase YvrE
MTLQNDSGTDPSDILHFPCGVERMANGNTLVVDAGAEDGSGSKVMEVTPAGEIIWASRQGYRFAHSARRTPSGTTLVADTTNNRIIEVDGDDNLIFNSKEWEGGNGRLSDGSQLDYPNNIELAGDGLWMVTCRNSNRYVLVDRQGTVRAASQVEIKHPHNCSPLPNGCVLLADSDANVVREVDPDGRTLWEFAEGLNWPRDANRLPNGNTLIADSKNSRVIEVTRDGNIVWEFAVDYFANFYEAHRLDTGNTLISDQQQKRVFEVSQAGDVVWEFRNFQREQTVLEKLSNGFFKKRGPDGMPLDWSLATRFSEGGGRFVEGKNDYGNDVPGMEYDRAGGLYFHQLVRCEPGAKFTFAGSLATRDLDGFACLQVAFIDDLDGLLCDASLAPKGTALSGDSGWMSDELAVTVPERASHASLRVFLTGKGSVYFNELRWVPCI